MHIYKVTNIINSKIYIGQTSKNSNISYLGSGPIILKAIRKYGKDNFKKEIIEYCESKIQLNEREIYWISHYNSIDRNIGYNISTGGNGGNLGEIVNKKLSDYRKGKIMAKDKDGNIFLIKSDDERYISGELVGLVKGNIPYNKGIPMSEEQKEKLRKYKKTEEQKLKISISHSKRPKTKIICINDGLTYTMREACEKFNLTLPNVINVLKQRAKATKGYSFKYV